MVRDMPTPRDQDGVDEYGVYALFDAQAKREHILRGLQERNRCIVLERHHPVPQLRQR
jgi:hypothetical protein